jgi:hypothetical protein
VRTSIYKRWTTRELSKLKSMMLDGMRDREIAAALGVSYIALSGVKRRFGITRKALRGEA